MLTLQSLLSLPVFLSTSLIAHALAAPGGYIDIDHTDANQNYAAALTGGDSCDDKQLKAIKDGFHEMNKLFAAAQNANFSNEPEIEFFGQISRIAPYTNMIQANLQRAAQYANQKGNGTRNPDIHVRCDDPNDACDGGGKKEGKHSVYNIGNEAHINFCKKYFDMDPLDKEVDEEAKKGGPPNLELMSYYNRATAWARMVMHISGVGSAVVATAVPNNQTNSTSEWMVVNSEGPMNTSFLAGVMDARVDTPGPNNVRILKYAYGVTRAKLLASLSTQNPYDAANNAENYALYAQARYIMQEKGFFPNMPIMSLGNDMAILTNSQMQDFDKKKYACFEMTDVVKRRDGTNVMGGPLPSSAPASTRAGKRLLVAVLWLSISYLGSSALG